MSCVYGNSSALSLDWRTLNSKRLRRIKEEYKMSVWERCLQHGCRVQEKNVASKRWRLHCVKLTAEQNRPINQWVSIVTNTMCTCWGVLVWVWSAKSYVHYNEMKTESVYDVSSDNKWVMHCWLIQWHVLTIMYYEDWTITPVISANHSAVCVVVVSFFSTSVDSLVCLICYHHYCQRREPPHRACEPVYMNLEDQQLIDTTSDMCCKFLYIQTMTNVSTFLSTSHTTLHF